MSQPSPEAIILREMLDIHEPRSYQLAELGVEIPAADKRRLQKLEKELAKVTNKE